MTFPDEPFSSYFSGNTVQICPVGALTAVALPLQGPAVGPRAGREHVHDLQRRVPHRRAVRRATSSCATSASTPTRSTGAGCATAAASTSRRPTPTTACWCRYVRGEGGLAETPWSVAWTPPPSSSGRRSTAVGPAASPSSAGPAARTRTPTRGRPSPTPSASPTATPSSATGCPPGCWRCRGPRSTRRTAAATVVLLAPDLKEELPVLHLRLRHAAEQRKVKIIELAPAATGLTAHRVAHRPDRGGAVGQRRGRPRRPRDRRPAARRSGRRRRRPGQPRRVGRCRGRRAARRARRLPRRQGAAGAAPRQRRRRAAARSRARPPVASTLPASSRPPPTATSISSCSSAPTR